MSDIIKQYSRMQNHRVTGTGVVFTVPTSEDFTDGSWLSTDLCRGEIGIQMEDDRVFARTDNGIIELTTTVGSSALWLRDSDSIYNADADNLRIKNNGSPSNTMMREYSFVDDRITTQGNLQNITFPTGMVEKHVDGIFSVAIGVPLEVWSLTTFPAECVITVEAVMTSATNKATAHIFSAMSNKVVGAFIVTSGVVSVLGSTPTYEHRESGDTYTVSLDVASGYISYNVTASYDNDVVAYVKYQIVQTN